MNLIAHSDGMNFQSTNALFQAKLTRIDFVGICGVSAGNAYNDIAVIVDCVPTDDYYGSLACLFGTLCGVE